MTDEERMVKLNEIAAKFNAECREAGAVSVTVLVRYPWRGAVAMKVAGFGTERDQASAAADFVALVAGKFPESHLIRDHSKQDA